MQKFKLKPADYMVIILIAITALGGFWHNLTPGNRPERKYVLIHLENEVIAELSLGPDETYEYRFNFGPEQENVAIVQVENGQIRLLELGDELCPRGICSHTGWISQPYERVVCLPNRIMIHFIERAGRESDLDGVTY